MQGARQHTLGAGCCSGVISGAGLLQLEKEAGGPGLDQVQVLGFRRSGDRQEEGAGLQELVQEAGGEA